MHRYKNAIAFAVSDRDASMQKCICFYCLKCERCPNKRKRWIVTLNVQALFVFTCVPVVPDACKLCYGSTINRIYTRNGASKRKRCVSSASSFRMPWIFSYRLKTRMGPARIVGYQKKNITTGILHRAWFPWTNIASQSPSILQLKLSDKTIAILRCHKLSNFLVISR